MPIHKHLSSYIAHFMGYNRRKWKPLIGWNMLAPCHRVLHRHKRWSTIFLPPPTSTPLATISLVYPLIVTLLWCFNTVLYLWSRFIYYLVLVCYIIYIQSKSYVNVYITLRDILLKIHEIMLIFANLHLIGYIHNVMICHLPHAL